MTLERTNNLSSAELLLSYGSDDKKLVELIQTADQTTADNALGAYWMRYIKMINTIVRRKGVPTDDIEDISSDVFVKFIQQFNKNRWRSIRNPKAWMCAVTQTAIIDYWRKKK